MIRDGKVIAKKFFEDYDGKKQGYIVGDFVNCFSFDKKGFINSILFY